LIEILIVLAIIAILAGILLPVFARAREGARTASCASNLKQMGMAFIQYTADNNQRFPGAGDYLDWSGGGHWVAGADSGLNAAMVDAVTGELTGKTALVEQGSLWPYVKSGAVYICPSNPTGEEKRLSYSMNCAVAFMSNARIRTPSEIVLLVDEDNANSGFFHAVDPDEADTVGTSTDALTQVHNGGGNLLFADGHVKFYPFNSFPLDTSPAGYANKWRRIGTPRFHDGSFGPEGSYFKGGVDAISGSPITMDSCLVTIS
jgi:prepilin-type processing-associated H-X9-DG protein